MNIHKLVVTASHSLMAVGLCSASLACSSDDADPAMPGSGVPDSETPGGEARYLAGSKTLCVVDSTRGFDNAAGFTDGSRLIIVEAWYPVAMDDAAGGRQTTFGDYFAGDVDLLVRSERAMMETIGFPEERFEQAETLGMEHFATPRDSLRDAPLAQADAPFPVVIYSHGTIQQRFTNDTMAENLAKEGYIVLSPEHTGNDALSPLGAFCPEELPGALPDGLIDYTHQHTGGALQYDTHPVFDPTKGEYIGQTFDPFFVVGDPNPAEGTINPREVALTMDRVADFEAVMDAAAEEFGSAARLTSNSVGIVGYSRGAMHGVAAAEILDRIGASVGLVGGTPFAFYERDAEANPLNAMLAAATDGARDKLSRVTKPLLEMTGGQDTRRKASTDAASEIGLYPFSGAENNSPIVTDTMDRLDGTTGFLVSVDNIDHYDFIDDPFILAFRGIEDAATRAGAYDPALMYMSRPASQRQAIRDYFVKAFFESALDSGQPDDLDNPYAGDGVQVTRY
jgi:dienelactone hydrolase